MSCRRHARAGCFVAALVAVACDGGAPSVVPIAEGRGVVEPHAARSPVDPSGLPHAGQQDPTRVRPPPLPHAPGGAPSPRPAAPASAGAGEPATATADGPGQDYSGAVRRAFGTPTSCISAETRARLQGTLSLTISVRATPAGRITSATVTGAGLSAEDERCLISRAEDMRLGPIEDAPRTLRAQVDYSVANTPAAQGANTRPDWQTPAGSQAPGAVLPARGPAARPPGSVQPDLTLSPGGTAGRPPGFVPPSSTLPATR